MINLDKPDTIGFKKELEELIFPLALSAIFLAALCGVGAILSYIPAALIVAGITYSIALCMVVFIIWGLVESLIDLIGSPKDALPRFFKWIKKTVTTTVNSYPGSMP